MSLETTEAIKSVSGGQRDAASTFEQASKILKQMMDNPLELGTKSLNHLSSLEGTHKEALTEMKSATTALNRIALALESNVAFSIRPEVSRPSAVCLFFPPMLCAWPSKVRIEDEKEDEAGCCIYIFRKRRSIIL